MHQSSACKTPVQQADAPSSLACLIGERTRRIRTQQGLTRRALSEKADISERYLALVEKGTGNVSILLLERIAKALDTRLIELVAEAEPRTQQKR